MIASTPSPVRRIASIDAFRALTMVLMIFVNDLWTLSDIPSWLEHTAADFDGMGLADWVFPGFLFIVGLSIPFAIQARYQKGDSKWKVFHHIVERSIALLIMGLFMVNQEMTDSGALLWIPKPLWTVLMILGFFLIWNSYGKDKKWWGMSPGLLQVLGVLILVGLALCYRAGSGDDLHWMQKHWWGILGLIGWGYLLCATIYLVVGNSLLWMSLAVCLLFGMNALEFLPVAFKPAFVVGAANHASVILGVWASVLLISQRGANTSAATNKLLRLWPLWMALLSIVLIVYGFGTRPIWGISKIQGTPSWVAICAGASITVFLALYWLCDRMKMVAWMTVIAPAGRSTLTCYLVPYWAYAIAAPLLFNLPDFWVTGWAGIVKSLLFALLIVQFTRLLELAKVRVRV